MAHAIEVHGLQKSFGPARALAGLDLTVRTGEVHALPGTEWRWQDDHAPDSARLAEGGRR